MKSRTEILSEAMLRPDHPTYKKLSYGRWLILNGIHQELLDKGEDDSGHELTGIRWTVCTREPEDAELIAALAAEDRIAAFRPLWHDALHIADAVKFSEWWKLEIDGQEAAATTHKPDTRLGKSEVSEEPIPAT